MNKYKKTTEPKKSKINEKYIIKSITNLKKKSREGGVYNLIFICEQQYTVANKNDSEWTSVEFSGRKRRP